MTFTPNDPNFSIMRANVDVGVRYDCDCSSGCDCIPPDDLLDYQYSDAYLTKPGSNFKSAASQNQMDIHWPRTPGRGVTNIVVTIHGGGFVAGDKREALHVANCVDRFLEAKGGVQDYVLVNLNYRLTHETNNNNAVTFWDLMDDVTTAIDEAIRLMKLNGYTPGVMAIGGISGGGLASMFYANTRGKVVRGTEPEPLAPAPIAFVFDICGPTNVNTLPTQGTIGAPDPAAVLGNLARNATLLDDYLDKVYTWPTGSNGANPGGANGNDTIANDITIIPNPTTLQKQKAAGSPLTYVDENSPPTIIWNGINDTLVPRGQAQAMHKILTDLGVESEIFLPRITVVPIVNIAHSSGPLSGSDPEHVAYMAALNRWINEYFPPHITKGEHNNGTESCDKP